MPITTRSKFWGPLFPDVRGVFSKPFWGALWPDPGDPLVLVPPTEPAGVATFAIDLEDNLDLTLEWQTDIFKAYNGTEQRRALLDNPRQRISGSALLVGASAVLTMRSKLARFAATGQPFSLGLPYESMVLTADAASTTVTVNATTLLACDWANPGQRVLIVASNRTSFEAVIQSASGVTLGLDIAPGVVGKAGGYVMPMVSIHLEPQQSFNRYRNPEGFELWKIDARLAGFGFRKSPRSSFLDIEATYPASGNLVGVIVQAREPGVAGDDIRVSFDDDSLSGVDFTEVGDEITVHFVPGVSTVGEVTTLINANASFVKCVGSWNETFVLGSADTFALTFLDGGSEGDYVADGMGATVALHASRPVFDRGTINESTIDEPLQAMNEIVELGGIPANVGQAAVSDWGRVVAIDRKQGAEWQWLKRFLATVRGRAVAFWLPTWRRDLIAVSKATNTLTVEGPDDADGGFFSWYPNRKDIQILQADGTINRVTITAAVDNGNGTITLTIGATLSASAISLVSWLELCRFETDAIPVHFQGGRFQINTMARVVTR